MDSERHKGPYKPHPDNDPELLLSRLPVPPVRQQREGTRTLLRGMMSTGMSGQEALKILDAMKPVEEIEVLPKLGEEWRSPGSSNANVQEIPKHYDQDLVDEIEHARYDLMFEREGLGEGRPQLGYEYFQGKNGQIITLIVDRSTDEEET